MSESTGRINVKKTSKCAVSISDISHEGSFVKLENTSATKVFKKFTEKRKFVPNIKKKTTTTTKKQNKTKQNKQQQKKTF